MSLTKTAQKRIQKDIQELHKNPLHSSGIYIKHDDNEITKATALLIGPEKTPYENGYYFFRFNFPGNYPFDPPKVEFLTHDPALKTRFHPNLYTQGKVCLSIINTWSGPSWTSVQTFASVLLSVKSLMDENPLANEPGYENADPSKHSNFNACIEYENLRVAILYNLKHLDGVLEHFRPVIERQYLENFTRNRERCVALKEKNQGKEFYCSVYSMTVKCDYAKLLAEMDALYGDLLLKYPDFVNNKAVDTTATGTTSPEPAPVLDAKITVDKAIKETVKDDVKTDEAGDKKKFKITGLKTTKTEVTPTQPTAIDQKTLKEVAPIPIHVNEEAKVDDKPKKAKISLVKKK